MATKIWVNIGSGNGLVPDGTKPLPEPMLTYHQSDPMTITWRQCHRSYPKQQSLKLAWTWLIKNFFEIHQGTMSQDINKNNASMIFIIIGWNHWSLRKFGWNFRWAIFMLTLLTDGWGILWNCPQINVIGPYIGSGNGLLPSGNKPFPEQKLTHIYVAIWCH